MPLPPNSSIEQRVTEQFTLTVIARLGSGSCFFLLLSFLIKFCRSLTGLKQFQEECLLTHNEYRLRHGAAPLQWSQALAWQAQCWAEQLARAGDLRHNDDDTVGENLAGMLGDELSGKEATDIWYDEIEDYDFDRAGYDEDTSNFSQVERFLAADRRTPDVTTHTICETKLSRRLDKLAFTDELPCSPVGLGRNGVSRSWSCD